VLKWVFERVNGDADAIATPIGKLPTRESFDSDGLDIDEADLDTLLAVDVDGWKAAIPQIRDHFGAFGDRLPASLTVAVDTLEANLVRAGTGPE
jgi:phosphoenolpyruvate carboxykinase (GTP)